MIGILTEKPSALRNFAKAFGGESGIINGEKYILASSRGHLYKYKAPHEMVSADLEDSFKLWNIQYLPWDHTYLSWQKKVKDETAEINGMAVKVLNDISNKLRGCSEIVIATDNDPTGEGEMIAWEIIDGLKLRPNRITRMYFVDESSSEIQKAFAARKVIKNKMSDLDYLKADYRSKFDFLTIQFTRVATACGDGRSVLRQGRLKSAMVLLVGDELKAVANYKKIPFYQNRFADENGNVFTDKNEPVYPTPNEVPRKYSPSNVVVDSTERKHTPPPALLDLAGLSSILAQKGIKSSTVLSTYQKMYEDQIVSYPRTADKKITLEQFNEMLPYVNSIANVVSVDPNLLTVFSPRPTHVSDGLSHGANRPGTNVPQSLGELEKYGVGAVEIYTILAKNFLAMFGADYEYEHWTAFVAAYPSFRGAVNIPLNRGYKQIFDLLDEADESENVKGFGKVASPFVYEGFPPKPPIPTMKWLMKQLEKHDVGTGATRTQIYGEVTDQRQKYPLLVDTKGKLTMTPYGEMSYGLLPGTHIGSIVLTEELTSDMRSIGNGVVCDQNIMLRRIARYVAEDIVTMSHNGEVMRREKGIKLETGSNTKQEKEYVEGIWAVNNSRVRFARVYCGHRFTDQEVELLLNGATIKLYNLISAKGKKFNAVGKLGFINIKGKQYFGFDSQFLTDVVPDEWCRHKFTPAEKEKLSAGQMIYADDFISSKGSIFKCCVSFEKKENGVYSIVPHFDKYK